MSLGSNMQHNQDQAVLARKAHETYLEKKEREAIEEKVNRLAAYLENLKTRIAKDIESGYHALEYFPESDNSIADCFDLYSWVHGKASSGDPGELRRAKWLEFVEWGRKEDLHIRPFVNHKSTSADGDYALWCTLCVSPAPVQAQPAAVEAPPATSSQEGPMRFGLDSETASPAY